MTKPTNMLVPPPSCSVVNTRTAPPASTPQRHRVRYADDASALREAGREEGSLSCCVPELPTSRSEELMRLSCPVLDALKFSQICCARA